MLLFAVHLAAFLFSQLPERISAEVMIRTLPIADDVVWVSSWISDKPQECVFHAMPATHSTGSRSVIRRDPGH
jgi:hypothetical protein